jgi:hypothetical protein
MSNTEGVRQQISEELQKLRQNLESVRKLVDQLGGESNVELSNLTNSTQTPTSDFFGIVINNDTH